MKLRVVLEPSEGGLPGSLPWMTTASRQPCSARVGLWFARKEPTSGSAGRLRSGLKGHTPLDSHRPRVKEERE